MSLCLSRMATSEQTHSEDSSLITASSRPRDSSRFTITCYYRTKIYNNFPEGRTPAIQMLRCVRKLCDKDTFKEYTVPQQQGGYVNTCVNKW